MTPDICFLVFAHVHHYAKFLAQVRNVMAYSDCMVIVEPCKPFLEIPFKCSRSGHSKVASKVTDLKF